MRGHGEIYNLCRSLQKITLVLLRVVPEVEEKYN
jgi:hypothetical protein